MSEKSGSRQQILDEKRNVTARISETCRFIGFGLLAVYYAVWIGEVREDVFNPIALYVIGMAGALTIAFDYAQYLCGAWSVSEALKRDDSLYDKASLAYRGRNLFFCLKQITAGVGAVALVVIMLIPAPVGANSTPDSAFPLGLFPHAGEAGMSIRNLKRGIFKPS